MRDVNIAIIGAGMIGAAHASSYRTHQARLSDESTKFILHTICDARIEAAQDLARTWGFSHASASWNEVINNPDIHVVSIALPNFMHAEVTEAAILAGKHVICEKPLALTVEEADRIVSLAVKSDKATGSVFNYRRIPAIARIKEVIESGEIGKLTHFLFQYQCGYAADPLLPYSWRYTKSQAGGGALHDIGAHAVDIARYLGGDISEIIGATCDTFIERRYKPLSANTGHTHVSLSEEYCEVDTDDISSCVLKFQSGCQGLFSASRVTVGMGNTLSFTLTGSKGTIIFNSETPGEFKISRDGQQDGCFTTVPNNPSFPFLSTLIPVPHDGVSVGYAEGFGFMISEFMCAVRDNKPFAQGSMEDGLAVARVLEAIQLSASEKRAVNINEFIR